MAMVCLAAVVVVSVVVLAVVGEVSLVVVGAVEMVVVVVARVVGISSVPDAAPEKTMQAKTNNNHRSTQKMRQQTG